MRAVKNVHRIFKRSLKLLYFFLILLLLQRQLAAISKLKCSFLLGSTNLKNRTFVV